MRGIGGGISTFSFSDILKVGGFIASAISPVPKPDPAAPKAPATVVSPSSFVRRSLPNVAFSNLLPVAAGKPPAVAVCELLVPLHCPRHLSHCSLTYRQDQQ